MKIMNKDTNFRVKQFYINENYNMYSFLLEQLHLSKNLYNATLYELRQRFFSTNTIINRNELNQIMKNKIFNNVKGYDYYSLATVHSAQQTMYKALSNMIYFFKSLKKYNENPTNYTGTPKIPKYKKKDGYYIVTLSNQNCKVKGNILSFPKAYGNFTLNIEECFNSKEYDFHKLSEVRYYLKHDVIVLEVVYQIKAKQQYHLRKDKICGIDLGVVNFASCSFNFNKSPILFDSNFIKSTNQLYSKKIAKYKSLAKTCNGRYMTKRLEALYLKRYRKIKDYMHKVSTYIVNECLKNRISKIVIGENKSWKQHAKSMRNFIHIPYTMFKKMIEYKAKLYGMKVIFVNETFTSGTSFLDNEQPDKKNYKRDRRIRRGLFVSTEGIAINADVNASLQIIRKYEIKENKRRRQMRKSLISCFKSNLKWKNIVSDIERVYII